MQLPIIFMLYKQTLRKLITNVCGYAFICMNPENVKKVFQFATQNSDI